MFVFWCYLSILVDSHETGCHDNGDDNDKRSNSIEKKKKKLSNKVFQSHTLLDDTISSSFLKINNFDRIELVL